MYDIAIIGAGPAGATLARLIGKKYKVLLVDRRPLTTPPNNRGVKCCGGLLAPDAQKMLARLGLGLPKEITVGPQIFVVRTIDLESKLERYYQRFYFNMDREEFDRWLVSLVPDSVDICCQTLFKSYQRKQQGFELKLLHKGQEIIKRARLIIGADGACSRVRKEAFPGIPTPDTYISIQEWYQTEDVLPYFSAIFDREVTDFYSWTIPKGDHFLLGAALELEDNAWDKFKLLKQKLKNYGFQFGERVKKEGAFIMRPNSLKQVYTGREGIALLGEAAGFISPSSAEGFSYAMRSGLIAGEILLDGIEDFCVNYKRETGKIRRNILLKNLKSPFMYNHMIRKMVMKTGIDSVKVNRRGI